jgi:hypothetical protein
MYTAAEPSVGKIRSLTEAVPYNKHSLWPLWENNIEIFRKNSLLVSDMDISWNVSKFVLKVFKAVKQ